MPEGAQMTRHEQAFSRGRQARPAPSFSSLPLAHRDHASPWSRDLLYGGGLIVAAVALALGWVTVRPTPRRREPELPAPAWVRRR
jgi:hypothetical protein